MKKSTKTLITNTIAKVATENGLAVTDLLAPPALAGPDDYITLVTTESVAESLVSALYAVHPGLVQRHLIVEVKKNETTVRVTNRRVRSHHDPVFQFAALFVAHKLTYAPTPKEQRVLATVLGLIEEWNYEVEANLAAVGDTHIEATLESFIASELEYGLGGPIFFRTHELVDRLASMDERTLRDTVHRAIE